MEYDTFIVLISSVQSLDRLDCLGDMRDDSAEVLFQSFLQEALVSSSGFGRGAHPYLLISCSVINHTVKLCMEELEMSLHPVSTGVKPSVAAFIKLPVGLQSTNH